MLKFYAHSGQDEQHYTDYQLLSDHLKQVAARAQEMAEAGRPGDTALAGAAFAAGLLHDLGKYRPEFQDHIRNLPVQREKTYHKQAGAVRSAKHLPIAFAILGHHGGLADFATLKNAITCEENKQTADSIWPSAIQDCFPLAELKLPELQPASRLEAELLTRLLFSCLVDADWSDTAAYDRQVRGLPAELPPPQFNPAVWLPRLMTYIAARARSCRDARVAAIRDEILRACQEAAINSPGLFTLTVPTGGGKTLSGFAFALLHAMKYGLRRVIYVAPYLSILEQNARIVRQALGFSPEDFEVFEHHSLAEPPGNPKEEDLTREAVARRAENWDAPVILTTNVQFFESLFANKPGRCRKLHNMARSVILLDECQTLPPGLASPTCAMLRQIADHLGSTVVLCTATQPAFAHPKLKAQERLEAREIIPPTLNLFERLRRVQLSWPNQRDERLTWGQVAERMVQNRAALCVVNTRKAAREVFRELRRLAWTATIYHLSTSMCPAHRLQVLDRVRGLLEKDKTCYLVSTQLIEAGVDVDFPCVMREMAPLEAIIQAAGRCNREGRLNGADGKPGGQVEVFRSLEGTLPTDPWYSAGRQVVETQFLAAGRTPRIDSPEDIQDYFGWLYHTGELDAKQIQGHRNQYCFPEVACRYQLITEETVPVVVSWADRRDEINNLVEAVRQHPSRTTFRRLIPFQVNLRRYEIAKAGGALVQADPRFDLLLWFGSYDPDLGLDGEQADALLMV